MDFMNQLPGVERALRPISNQKGKMNGLFHAIFD